VSFNKNIYDIKETSTTPNSKFTPRGLPFFVRTDFAIKTDVRLDYYNFFKVKTQFKPWIW
jgi:hypothetical protein